MEGESYHLAEWQSNPRLGRFIMNVFGSQLDDFSVTQHHFFAACRNYARDFSEDRYAELESAALFLEIGVVDTMYTITQLQPRPINKLRMSYAFSVAENAMRIAVFREIVPCSDFETLLEPADCLGFDEQVEHFLAQNDAGTIFENLVGSTVDGMHEDLKNFTEMVAIA